MFLLIAATALATPTTLDHQGRLIDGDGLPLDGVHDVVFQLYDAATGGASTYDQTESLDLDNGYFHVTLGPFEDTAFDRDQVYVGISVDGVAMPDRLAMSAVPWAFRARVAESVFGGDVVADTLTVGGTVLVDGTGAFVGPADGDTLADLDCDGGQTALWNGAAWVCGDNDTFAHLSCPADFSLTWNSAANGWGCALNDPYSALQCTSGASPVFTDQGWTCRVVDTDTDTLAALSCDAGETAVFDALGDQAWGCAENDPLADIGECAPADAVVWQGTRWACAPNDALAGLRCEVGQSISWDGLSQAWTCADGLEALSLVCADGQAPVWHADSGQWGCEANVLTELEVETLVGNGGLDFAGAVTAPTVAVAGAVQVGSDDVCEDGDDAGKLAWIDGEVVVCDGGDWQRMWPIRNKTLLDDGNTSFNSSNDTFRFTIPAREAGTLTAVCSTCCYSSVHVYTANNGRDSANQSAAATLIAEQGPSVNWGFDHVTRMNAQLSVIDKDTGLVELNCNSSTNGNGRARVFWEYIPW